MQATATLSQTIQHTVSVKGMSIPVNERGSGTPMLLLHGSPDTREMWTPLMERLAPLARCFAPDLPGFGSTVMPDDYSLALENMTAFTHDLLAALRITEPVILVATDFGMHYALAFAVKHPDMVRGLVLSNSAFFRDYEWHGFAKLYRMPVIGEVLMATTSKPVLRSTLKSFAPRLPEAYIEQSFAQGFGSPKTRKAILRMYRERDPKDFAGWDDQMVALVKQKPALVLWGDRDPFIAPAFAERFGAAQVHHFTEFSHWLPLEAPDQYAEKVIAWLKTI